MKALGNKGLEQRRNITRKWRKILTETESLILEHIRNGLKTTAISQLIDKHVHTINTCLKNMIIKNYLKRVKRGAYKVLLQEYEVTKPVKPKRAATIPANTEFVQKWVEQTMKMIKVELSEEQELYLDNHRHMKRTELAKKLVITKPQLCYVLDQRRNVA